MTDIAARLARAHDAVTHAGFILAVVALAGLLASYCVEVIQRSFLAAPTAWSADIVTYLLAAQFLLALPAVTAARRHIIIRFLVDRLAPALAARVAQLVGIAAAVGCLVTAVFALDLALTQSARDAYTVATIQIPKSWLSMLVAYGFASSGLYFLRRDADASFSVPADDGS